MMATSTTPPAADWTVADLLDRFGQIDGASVLPGLLFPVRTLFARLGPKPQA